MRRLTAGRVVVLGCSVLLVGGYVVFVGGGGLMSSSKSGRVIRGEDAEGRSMSMAGSKSRAVVMPGEAVYGPTTAATTAPADPAVRWMKIKEGKVDDELLLMSSSKSGAVVRESDAKGILSPATKQAGKP